MSMILFAGLGNPGPRYEKTRHNIGFRIIDAIVSEFGLPNYKAKFQAQVSEGWVESRGIRTRIVAVKPQTFYNESGQAVGEAHRFYKMPPEDVVVFHDEVDLAPGKVRVKSGGGHAGNNGIRSVAAHLGPDFHRVRVGVGHPGDKRLVSKYVLNDFTKTETAWLDPLISAIAENAALLVEKDTNGFMNKVHLSIQDLFAEPDTKTPPHEKE